MCIILHALCVPAVGVLVVRRNSFTVSLHFSLISSIVCNKNDCFKQNLAVSRRPDGTQQQIIARATEVAYVFTVVCLGALVVCRN